MFDLIVLNVPYGLQDKMVYFQLANFFNKNYMN